MSDNITRSKEKNFVKISGPYLNFETFPYCTLNFVSEDNPISTEDIYEKYVLIRETGFIENVKLYLNSNEYFDAQHVQRVVSIADLSPIVHEITEEEYVNPIFLRNFIEKKNIPVYSIFVAPVFFSKAGIYSPYWTYQVDGITVPPLSDETIKVYP